MSFSSGLAAEAALFLTLLRAGDHAVVARAVYGGTVRLFRQLLADLGISVTFVDATDPAQVARAITPRTRLVFLETPANPTLALTDIAACAAAARARGVLTVVDNTFLTPVLQRPLALGADVSLYSTTKHIDGHSAALGGAITTHDTELLARLRFIRKCVGSIQTPFNAWLTLQGLKTLPLRLAAQSKNALRIASWLASRPGVTRVCYPGLPDFPQRALAAAQHLGHDGAVVSFEIAGGLDSGKTLARGLRLCRLVEHIGSVESLLTHPASMTHADVPRELRLEAGVTDGLLRLSVGLEDPADVIDDLDRSISVALDLAPDAVPALASARAAAPAPKGGEPCAAR